MTCPISGSKTCDGKRLKKGKKQRTTVDETKELVGSLGLFPKDGSFAKRDGLFTVSSGRSTSARRDLMRVPQNFPLSQRALSGRAYIDPHANLVVAVPLQRVGATALAGARGKTRFLQIFVEDESESGIYPEYTSPGSDNLHITN